MIFRRSKILLNGQLEELECRRLLTSTGLSGGVQDESTVADVRLEQIESAANEVETKLGSSVDAAQAASSDDQYQVLEESSGVARLDHDWIFALPPNEGVSVDVEAHTDSSEDFWVSYSLDGGEHFQNFLTVASNSDLDRAFRFDLPSSESDQLIIKIRDSIASSGDAVSRVYVDRLVINTLHEVSTGPTSEAGASAVTTPRFPSGARVMIIGDSISSGINASDAASRGYAARGSYRPELWDLIQSNNVGNVEFVGSSTYNSAGLPDKAAAHTSYRGFATYSFLPYDKNELIGSEPNGKINDSTANADGWGTLAPDIALIMVGANDVLEGRAPNRSRDTIRDMIGELRTDNRDVVILVGTVAPFADSRQNSNDVPEFNRMLADLVHADGSWKGSTSDSPIYIVDHYGGVAALPRYRVDAHSADGIHPNASGDKLLADNWWSFLDPLLTGEGSVQTTTASQQTSVAAADVQEDLVVADNIILDIDKQQDVVEGNEGDNREVEFTIRIRGNNVFYHPINVYYSAENGSAKSGSDFVAQSDYVSETLKKIVIPAYTNQVKAAIPIVSDSIAEGAEGFKIRLRVAAPQNGVAPNAIRLGDTITEVFIHDDDIGAPAPTPAAPPVSDNVLLDLQDATVNEGNPNASFDITIRDGKTFFHSIYAYVSTVNGSAKAGSDFKEQDLTRILIPAGVNRITANVPILSDNRREGTENFQLKIVAAAATDGVAPNAVHIGKALATGTIYDND